MIDSLKTEWRQNLTDSLDWWKKYIYNPTTGFNGKVNIYNEIDPKADKGLVLFARLLYTFSKASIFLKDEELKVLADKVYLELQNHFNDEENSGYYWSIDANNQPKDTTKKTYGQAFVLYGLTAYYELTQDSSVLNKAISLFSNILLRSKDAEFGGYIEAFDQYWQPIEDIRLSEKDANLPKSMNTHLHVMEAFTALLNLYPHDDIEEALTDIINIFINHIICNKTYHQHLFFTLDWKVASTTWSYGHDIETSWLLRKAIKDIKDATLQKRVEDICLKMLDASLEGIDTDGGMFNELNYETNHLDKEKHWWPQAEAMVGCWVGYKTTQNIKYLHTLQNLWNYTKENIIDKKNGEWFWGRNQHNEILHPDEKAGFWKCSYHNGRALMELL